MLSLWLVLSPVSAGYLLLLRSGFWYAGAMSDAPKNGYGFDVLPLWPLPSPEQPITYKIIAKFDDGTFDIDEDGNWRRIGPAPERCRCLACRLAGR